MSPDRWKITGAPGRARIEAVYCRGLGRATRRPLPRMKSSVASSIRPLLGSARRSLSEVISEGEVYHAGRQLAAVNCPSCRPSSWQAAGASGASAGEGLLDQIADNVRCGDVAFLDSISIGR